jgi:hypothetical protein
MTDQLTRVVNRPSLVKKPQKQSIGDVDHTRRSGGALRRSTSLLAFTDLVRISRVPKDRKAG